MEEKVVVNTEETTPSEEEVVKPEAETETAPAATEQETTEPQAKPSEQGNAPVSEAVDEFGVPWKNRAMEWQRKFTETTENIPKYVEEALSKQKPNQRQYSISELEQYALEHPEYRPWVEEEKAKIIQNNVAKVAEERVKEVETKQKDDSTRQQAFQWTVNHPRLQECFTVDAFGRKVWNNAHPLTQMIGGYMQDGDLKSRPDALVIASKLALADYLDFQNQKSQSKAKALQQNLKKVQKQTFIEGAGTKNVATKGSFVKAREQLAKTGRKEDAKAAVYEYLKNIGSIAEE